MKCKWIWKLLLFLAVLLLTGCNMRTVDELYLLPKRSEAYTNLQTLIDDVMVGKEYSAPLSGENRQIVQMVDLDGDSVEEYLLFAKDNDEKPLHIYIFAGEEGEYTLLDSIESTGSAFEQVEYVKMDNAGGYEIVVGRQVSDQVLRSVSVYTMQGSELEQCVTANYSKFVCHDLDSDGFSEMLLLRPGDSESDNGIAELYGIEEGTMERSAEVNMSEPSDAIKRIMVSRLNDGNPAVYVASDVDGNAIITDVYAIVNGEFTNVSFSNESGTSVQTLRNYYVYADDIDDDGILELPSLITMKLPNQTNSNANQYLIRWYAMDSDGSEIDKLYSYHNYVGGWYMRLDSELAPRMCVLQQGNAYEFYIWDEAYNASEKIMTVYVLTGQKRDEQATIDNRFVLHRTESTVYAANLEVASASYGISKDGLINSLRMILQDWNTGET